MAGFIIVVGITIALMVLMHTAGHNWKYRNPYDRRCKLCHSNEVYFTMSYASDRGGWWEEMNYPNEDIKSRVCCA